MIRTPAGDYVKENPEITQKLENTISSLKLAVRQAEILSTLKGNPAWETVQQIIRAKLKTIDAQLKKFAQIDQRQVDLLLQQRSDFEYLVDIVDDFSDSVLGFQMAIERNEKELDARKRTHAS